MSMLDTSADGKAMIAEQVVTDEVATTTLEEVVTDTIPKRLQAHGWGAYIAKSTFQLTDVRGICLAAGALRYHLSKAQTRLYYRGQADDYASGIIPSLYRKTQTKEERLVRDEKLSSAITLIKGRANWDPKGTPWQSEALAQHYGLRTRWVDVVDHWQTAAWFACHRDSNPKTPSGPSPQVGYIYLIAIPETSGHAVVDLRERGSNWLRPHIQQGFAVQTDADRPDVNDCLVARFVVDDALLRSISGYGFYTKDVFFPPRGNDQGRYFWAQAAKVLKEELSEEDFELLVWDMGFDTDQTD